MRIFTLTLPRKIAVLFIVSLLLCLAASAFTPFGRHVAAHYLPLRSFARLTAPIPVPMSGTLTVTKTADTKRDAITTAASGYPSWPVNPTPLGLFTAPARMTSFDTSKLTASAGPPTLGMFGAAFNGSVEKVPRVDALWSYRDFGTALSAWLTPNWTTRTVVVVPKNPSLLATLLVINADDSGAGSLRAAIQQANATNGDDTITFDSSFNTARTINLTSGGLLIENGTGISGSITIQGPGADLLTINGPGNSRVFTITNVTTAMSGLTIRGGRVTSTTGNVGGGVLTDAPLTMTNCVVTGNYADYGGGGIHLEAGGASLSLDGCTISGNSTDTTNNQRGFGGGILTFRGITLKNTTIANNTSYYGGGIWMGTLPAMMINTTISGNTSVFGGGIFANEVTAAITATNTIVSGNNGIENVFLFNNAPAVAGSNNFINGNALLAPLGNYGGRTPTMPLLPGSPAINGGVNTTGVPTVDQRGVSRVGNVDIGAVESRGFTLAVNGGNNQSTIPTTAFANPLAVTVSSGFGEPVQGGLVTFTAPGSGPSATLTSPAALNASGQTSVNATANATAGGPYQVTASANGLTTGSFNLSNTCPTFTVGTPTTTGTLGLAYSSSAAATPAVSAPLNYRYALANSTTLPAGLSLNPNTGAITGTPTATGNVSFDIRAQLFNDNAATGCAVTMQRSINITCVTDPVVTSAADSGTGSLREAIAIACPGSTITFANGVNLITLMTGQLAVNKNLTFQGPGANLLTISGNNASRVFDIGFGVTVNFNDLTIANGNNTSLGGGIQSLYTASTVNLTNCTLTNNTASSSGGGIYSGSNLTLTNCTLSNNTATILGGGIYASLGTLTITGSTITNNSATGSFSSGGGIYQGSDRAMTITGSTISNNTATSSGGGIYNSVGTLTITDSTITGNSVTGNFSSGGGIYSGSSKGMTVTNTTISGNSSDFYGGGLYNSSGPATITGCTIANNSSGGSNGGYGGGIYHQSSNAMTIIGSTISGNRLNGNSFANGGGLSISGLATLINSTIAGNTVNGSGDNRGGGLYNDSSRLNLINCTVADNVVSGGTNNRGGGIYHGFQSNVRNAIIAGNSAATGPDVYTFSSPFTSQGHNLIGKGNDSMGFTNGVNNDQVGSIATPLDAKLAPLGNYGGTTQTMRPLIGSPAIDTGGPVSEIQQIVISGFSGDYTLTFNGQTTGNLAWNANRLDVQTALEALSNIGVGDVVVEGCCGALTVFFRGTLANSNQPPLTASGTATVSLQTFLDGGTLAPDQRGFARPQGSAVDIGAVEVNYALAATSGTPQSTTVNSTFANSLVATLTESNLPVSNVLLTFTAPGSGPSATFPNGNTATTNASGQASVSVAANTISGSAYTVTANTTPGLATAASFSLTNTCPTINAQVSGGGAICPTGTAQVFVNVSGGTAPYTVTLNNGGGTLMGSGPFIFNVSPSSTTTYSVQSAMDANGCPVMTSGSALVTVNALPETPTISGNLSFCSNGSTTLTATGSGTFMWFKNNTLIPGQSTNMLTVLEAGSYTVKVTDANSCASATSQPAVVSVNPLPAAPTISGTLSFCQGSGTTLTASGTGTFMWFKDNTPISGQTTNTLNVTSAGSYTVKVTDGNSCASATSQAAIVSVNALPETPTISGNLSFCSNGSTTLTATGSGTFMWFKNNTLIPGQSTNMLTVLEAGSYTVKVTDANSCASATSQPAVVTIKPTPVVNPATPAAICSGTQTNIVLGSTPSGATFNWTASLHSGSVTGFSNSSGNTIAQTLTGNGVVKYIVTATLDGCPSAPVEILQTVNALTTTSALTARTVCEGSPVSFTTTASGTGPFSFVWKKGATTLVPGGNLSITTNGNTSTLALAAAAVADAGSYSVEVTGICNTVTQTASLVVNTLPTITDPASVNLLQGGTASFSVTPTGTPTPSVQWQVSTDGGNTFADIPSATSTTLSLPNVTPAMNGYRYRAIAANTCGTATSRAATLHISPYGVRFEDPLVCLTGGDLVTLTASITNQGAAAVAATFSVTNLAPNLIGIPGSGLASVAPANFIITTTSANWNGTLQAGETVTFAFKAQLAPNLAQGAQVCVTSTATLQGGTPVTLTPCTTLACPTAGVAPRLSTQKPGSLLVFPYYTSKLATKADTRFTLSNVGATAAFVHLFFIDGASCQPTDQFLCLTPGASYAGKASETDGETTGWMLAVAVNPQGHPIQANQLIGNAFVNDGEYVDTYGAEAFTAHSSLLAAVQGDTALLFLDGQGYDAVANQLAVEIQSPVNAPQQKVVTVGLRGDLNASTVSGAGQIGTGLLINGNEKPLGSFTSWLNGSCQAIATITAGSPRVPTGVSGMIPSGEHGTLQWRIGGGVGLLLTPRSAQWKGIRPLHKTGLTTASLRIPLFPPHC